MLDFKGRECKTQRTPQGGPKDQGKNLKVSVLIEGNLGSIGWHMKGRLFSFLGKQILFKKFKYLKMMKSCWNVLFLKAI